VSNPFIRTLKNGQRREAVSCADRIADVQNFGTRQCLDAMALECVQPAVRQAIQRRLRFLDRKSRVKP